METPPSLFIPHSLRCEYGVNPLGVETTAPRLSWQLPVLERGQRQTAYQVLVAGDEGTLWDSGKVCSDQCLHVAYAGKPLRSGQRCYWSVRAWDEQGLAGDYSEPAYWEMGMLQEGDWVAQWIGPAAIAHEDLPALAPPSPIFRKEITLDKPLASARAHVSGLGYFALYLNGARAGDHVLDPAFTRYDVRTLYATHDVTALLRPGANAIGVMLGNGWYNCSTQEVWNFAEAPWRDHPKLLFQLHLTYTDGSTETVVSDLSWKASTGPLVFDALRNGETYDARKEQPGWTLPAFNDAHWMPVAVIPAPGGVLRAQRIPCKVMQTITPTAATEVKPGIFVVDMGQAFAGWAQLTVSGPAGTEVTLRYAEKLTADGEIDQSNLNGFVKSGDFQTDRYTLKGDGVEVWEPRFTYHGFRYVQVSGFPGTPTVESLRGRVVHTAFASAGEFACSNEMLNAVQRCTRWAYISNFVGIPTDCPHREKNGWTGDALLAAETGLLNYAAAPAYTKWLDDIADAQRPSGQLPGIVPTGGWGYNWGSGPAWDSAFTHIPWYLYQYCGDEGILAAHYAGMKRYVDFMTRMATDDIVSFGLGDWCPPNETPAERITPAALTSTGYYYANCELLSRIAALLGEVEDAENYAALAARIQTAFRRAFYQPERGRYSGQGMTAMGCALFQGLVEPAEQAQVLAALLAAAEESGYHADFGILGAKYVLNALSEHGRTDAAYRIAAQTSYPSWGHWIAEGATTLWESWDGGTSRNHIMFGDISAWMYKTLAGINPDPAAPGFKRIIIHPHPVAGLTWARAEHASMYGPIRSSWRREDDAFTLEVSIPANTTATVYLPAGPTSAISESGTPLADATGVSILATGAGFVALAVGAGEYCFRVG